MSIWEGRMVGLGWNTIRIWPRYRAGICYNWYVVLVWGPCSHVSRVELGLIAGLQ